MLYYNYALVVTPISAFHQRLLMFSRSGGYVTLLPVCFITGHAFVGSYTARFYPRKTYKIPRLRGQPLDRCVCHPTLPAFRARLLSLSYPCQPLQHERWQSFPDLPGGDQGILQAAGEAFRPGMTSLAV